MWVQHPFFSSFVSLNLSSLVMSSGFLDAKNVAGVRHLYLSRQPRLSKWIWNHLVCKQMVMYRNFLLGNISSWIINETGSVTYFSCPFNGNSFGAQGFLAIGSTNPPANLFVPSPQGHDWREVSLHWVIDWLWWFIQLEIYDPPGEYRINDWFSKKGNKSQMLHLAYCKSMVKVDKYSMRWANIGMR